MNRLLFLLLLCSAQIGFAQNAADELQDLMDNYWNYRLQENPTLATRAGFSDSNHLLPQVSPVDQARRLRSERVALRPARVAREIARELGRLPRAPVVFLDAVEHLAAESSAFAILDEIRARTKRRGPLRLLTGPHTRREQDGRERQSACRCGSKT